MTFNYSYTMYSVYWQWTDFQRIVYIEYNLYTDYDTVYINLFFILAQAACVRHA